MGKQKRAFLKKLGRKIGKIRAQKGYSQARLALESGIDRASIYRIEGGLSDPQVWTLNKIAHTIGVSVRKFFEFD